MGYRSSIDIPFFLGIVVYAMGLYNLPTYVCYNSISNIYWHLHLPKDMSNKSSRSSRRSLTIRSKVTLNRILEVNNNSVKIEINEKGTITGRYLGNQIATIDNTTNQDGTSSWSGKFVQMTNKGDMMVATGSGTGDPPNSKGIVKIRGEGDMWTGSTRLANLNGAKWTCEGENNIRKGSSVIRIEIKE